MILPRKADGEEDGASGGAWSHSSLREPYLSVRHASERAIEEAYLTALQVGRKEMWHDLRKNPNDLPEDCAINQDGKRVLYDCINKVWRNDDADEYICDDPIAWCEIPTFKEKQ